MHHHSTLYARFSDPAAAERAADVLLERGWPSDALSVVHGSDYVAREPVGESTSGAAKGATVGLAIGAMGALACLVIPGLGTVFGTGALATAMAALAGGPAVGAVAGSLTGFLRESGVEDVEAYEAILAAGGAILAVQQLDGTALERRSVEGVLASHGAEYIHVEGEEIAVAHVDVERAVRAAEVSEESRDAYYRRHFDEVYPNEDYAYYEPAYHYGSELAADENYRGKEWHEFELEASDRWYRRYPKTPWGAISGAAQHGFRR